MISFYVLRTRSGRVHKLQAGEIHDAIEEADTFCEFVETLPREIVSLLDDSVLAEFSSETGWVIHHDFY